MTHLLGLVVDSTAVIVAFVGILPSCLTVYLAYRIRRELLTDSGERLGSVVERTHDLAATNSAQLKQHGAALRRLNGDQLPPAGEPGE